MISKKITGVNPYVDFTSGGVNPDGIPTKKISIQGYLGLTFFINDSEYPVQIFNGDKWEQIYNNEINLKYIRFDPDYVQQSDMTIIINVE